MLTRGLTYEILRIVNEREYQRLRRQIEDDAKRKLEALELVWQMMRDPRNGPASDDDVNPVKRGAIDAAVRRVLPHLSDIFDPRDVIEKVEESEPELAGLVNRTTVSSALRRLAEEDRLDVVEQGKGKRPTRYRVRGVSLKPSDAVSEPDEPMIEPDEPMGEPITELTDDDIPF
jgi:hypothetical protein